jgi:hypothetical protein
MSSDNSNVLQPLRALGKAAQILFFPSSSKVAQLGMMIVALIGEVKKRILKLVA